MRKNAIIRIVLWSFVLIILLGIFCTALLWNGYFLRRRSTARSEDPTEATMMQTDGFALEFSPERIRKIEIGWVSGNIILQPDDTADTIRLSESGTAHGKYPMVCKASGDSLSIQYSRDSISFPSFGINLKGDSSKDLIILVPSDWNCHEIEVDTAFADITFRDMTIGSVSFDGASGYCSFENCSVNQLDIDTASGDIRFQGTLQTLDFDAASASFFGELTNTPSRVDMDGASSDLELVLPADTGFTVNMDGMSGNFSSDFPTESRNGSFIFGDGRCRINVDGMSADVSIRQAK